MPLGNYKRQLGNDEPLIISMNSLNKTSTPAVNLNMPESTFGMIRQGTEKLRSLEMPFLPKTSALRYLPGELAAETERLIIPQSEVEGLMQIAPIGMVAKSIGKTPIGKKIAQVVQREVAPKIFQGFQDLTTKFLNYAKGKTTLSKQEIVDFAKRPELKKGEADLLLKKLEEFEPAKGVIPQELQPLAQEARKYKSAEEFVKEMKRGYVNQTGDFSISPFDIAKEFESGEMELVSKISRREQEYALGRIPIKKLTIYRATEGKNIRPGDYVSANRKYAEMHLKDILGGEGKIIKRENVGLDELVATGSENELLYIPNWIKKFTTEQSLTDFYAQAVKGVKEGKLPAQEFADSIRRELKNSKNN